MNKYDTARHQIGLLLNRVKHHRYALQQIFKQKEKTLEGFQNFFIKDEYTNELYERIDAQVRVIMESKKAVDKWRKKTKKSQKKC